VLLSVRWLLAGALLVAGLACGSAEKSKASPPSPEVEQPYDDISIDPTTGVAALSGSWTGNADIKGYGIANAVLFLDAKGDGHYAGSLSGIPQSGSLRVSYWDGQWLQAEAGGYQQRIRGRLRGNQLHLNLPYVGSVVLYRAGR
jgi:hypothetical protein